MHDLDAFSTWAPDESPWSLWAKPVAFTMGILPSVAVAPAEVALRDWLPEGTDLARSFAIIDEPGVRSIALGLALARKGFRPVPLFNGVDGDLPVVEVASIYKALVWGAHELRALRIPRDAPPAFLLDSNRLDGYATPGMFDNRWAVVPEDFPSANRLKSAGLTRGLLLTSHTARDLPHVLLRYRRAGIELLEAGPKYAPRPHTPVRPSAFGTLFARMLVLAGLRRSSAGGFGSTVPIPPEGGGYS